MSHTIFTAREPIETEFWDNSVVVFIFFAAVIASLNRVFNTVELAPILCDTSKAESILKEYLEDYEKWYEFRNVISVVKDIQKITKDLANEKIETTLSKLKSSCEEDKKVVRVSMENMADELLDKFIYKVKKYGSKEDIKVYFRCLSDAVKEN